MSAPPERELPPGWHRPKTQLFRALVVLWIFPSIGALLILAMTWSAWAGADSARAIFEETRFEQWIALGLLLAHAVMVVLARHYGRRERPVKIPSDENPAPGDVDKGGG
jgi:hypothetical protein